MNEQQLSIIIPAFNESETLRSTLDRIRSLTVESDRNWVTEVIIVSDGSSDDTFLVAAGALGDGLDGEVIELVDNVGSHTAIRCGLERARGDFVAVLSADGQDPPESLPTMMDKASTGIDIVWGRRSSRSADPWLTRTIAGWFYRVFRWTTRLDYPETGLDFLLMTRPVADALLQYRERGLPLFLTVFNLGFSQTYVDYDREERTAGESGWTWRKKMRAAGDMFLAVSAAPLRILSIIGMVVGLLGLLFGTVTIVRAAFGHVDSAGWASLMTAITVMGGLILIGIAMLGECVWRTLEESG
ncbi:MAG: glycosyltransferase family 2 protein, partial [Actinomycetota bacterium]|nr:glycosyltransferase family 2 protein [Actinomycetota bacterium]